MPRRNSSNKQSRASLPQLSTGAACQSKRRFPTEKQAKRAADDQMLTNFHLELDTYRCSICRNWHLTSKGYTN